MAAIIILTNHTPVCGKFLVPQVHDKGRQEMTISSGAMSHPTTTATMASAQQPRRHTPDDGGGLAPARRWTAPSPSKPDRDRCDPAEHGREPPRRGYSDRSLISNDYAIRDVVDDDDNRQGRQRPKRRTRRKTLPASLRRNASIERIKLLRRTSMGEASKAELHTKSHDSTDSTFYEGWQDVTRRMSSETPMPPGTSKKVDENKSKEFVNGTDSKDNNLGHTCHSEIERAAILTPRNSDNSSRDFDGNCNIFMVSREDNLQFATGPHNSTCACDGSYESVPSTTGSFHSNTVDQHSGNKNDEIPTLVEDFPFKSKLNRDSAGELGNRELSNQGSTLIDESKPNNAQSHQNHRIISMPNIPVSTHHNGKDLHGIKDSGRPIMDDYIALKLLVAELQSELQAAHFQLRRCAPDTSPSVGNTKQLKDKYRKLRHRNNMLQKQNAGLREDNLFFLSLFAYLDRMGRLEGVTDAEFLEGFARAAASADGNDGELESRVRESPSLENVHSPSTKGSSTRQSFGTGAVKRPNGSNSGAKSFPSERSSAGTTTTAMSSDVERQHPCQSRRHRQVHQHTHSEEKNCQSSLPSKAISKARQSSAREGNRTVGREDERLDGGHRRRHPKQSHEPQRISASDQPNEMQDDRGVGGMLPRFGKRRDKHGEMQQDAGEHRGPNHDHVAGGGGGIHGGECNRVGDEREPFLPARVRLRPRRRPARRR